MNIYNTHNWGYNSFQIYHKQEMQNNIGYLQLSGQTSTLFSVAPKCDQRLAYASETRNLHNANKHSMYHCTQLPF